MRCGCRGAAPPRRARLPASPGGPPLACCAGRGLDGGRGGRGAVDSHVTLGAQRLAELFGQRASFYVPAAQARGSLTYPMRGS